MALTLHLHPLSSYCHKVLFALYENDIPFTPKILNLQDKEASAEFFKAWPLGKMPLLQDDARHVNLPETTLILEYLDQNYPGKMKLFPSNLEACREARLWDRIFDLYLHQPMQKVVGDKIRPADARDPFGVTEAETLMRKSYDMFERHIEKRQWILGDVLSVADCAALPALFYGGIVAPYQNTHPHVAAYFERLYARPSVKRALDEAKPYLKYFPLVEKVPARFL